jgi:hypothetical protein
MTHVEQTGREDQTASDLDQTSSNRDQTSSHQDQAAADQDQAASDRDQESSDADQAAADDALSTGSDGETDDRSTRVRKRPATIGPSRRSSATMPSRIARVAVASSWSEIVSGLPGMPTSARCG